MRKIMTALAASALALSGATAHAKTAAEKGEAELAKLLEGRTAGEPVDCITTNRFNGLRVIEGTAIIYDAGKTIYVARPSNPRSLGWDDILVIDRFSGSRLCTTDIIRTIDRGSRFPTGVIFLEEFVPYTKTDDKD